MIFLCSCSVYSQENSMPPPTVYMPTSADLYRWTYYGIFVVWCAKSTTSLTVSLYYYQFPYKPLKHCDLVWHNQLELISFFKLHAPCSVSRIHIQTVSFLTYQTMSVDVVHGHTHDCHNSSTLYHHNFLSKQYHLFSVAKNPLLLLSRFTIR